MRVFRGSVFRVQERKASVLGAEYTDTTAENGITYYYVMRSVDDDGDESLQTLQLRALAGIGRGS